MGKLRFERRGGVLTAAGDMEPPEPEETGEVCYKCLTRLREGELFGVCGGKVLCGECADEEWSELSQEEKLEILGYEVEVQSCKRRYTGRRS